MRSPSLSEETVDDAEDAATAFTAGCGLRDPVEGTLSLLTRRVL